MEISGTIETELKQTLEMICFRTEQTIVFNLRDI